MPPEMKHGTAPLYNPGSYAISAKNMYDITIDSGLMKISNTLHIDTTVHEMNSFYRSMQTCRALTERRRMSFLILYKREIHDCFNKVTKRCVELLAGTTDVHERNHYARLYNIFEMWKMRFYNMVNISYPRIETYYCV